MKKPTNSYSVMIARLRIEIWTVDLPKTQCHPLPTRRPRAITETSTPTVHVNAANTCIIHVHISTEWGKHRGRDMVLTADDNPSRPIWGYDAENVGTLAWRFASVYCLHIQDSPTILKVDETVLWDVGNHTPIYTASHFKGRDVKKASRLGILQLSLPTWY